MEQARIPQGSMDERDQDVRVCQPKSGPDKFLKFP